MDDYNLIDPSDRRCAELFYSVRQQAILDLGHVDVAKVIDEIAHGSMSRLMPEINANNTANFEMIGVGTPTSDQQCRNNLHVGAKIHWKIHCEFYSEKSPISSASTCWIRRSPSAPSARLIIAIPN